MLAKQSVLPNFIRTIVLVAIASLSFSANAMHHEKDMKKAKSEHMHESADKMHDGKMKDELSDKYKKDMKTETMDLEEGEEAMEDAVEEAVPE